MIKRSTLLSISLALAVSSAQSESDSCERTDHLTEAQCLASTLDRLNVELENAYRSALDSRPEKDSFDTRKTSGQLRRSQSAWMQYNAQNCTLMGGLEGGSNLAVTEFEARCEKEEIEKRIQFLKRVANGGFDG